MLVSTIFPRSKQTIYSNFYNQINTYNSVYLWFQTRSRSPYDAEKYDATKPEKTEDMKAGPSNEAPEPEEPVPDTISVASSNEQVPNGVPNGTSKSKTKKDKSKPTNCFAVAKKAKNMSSSVNCFKAPKWYFSSEYKSCKYIVEPNHDIFQAVFLVKWWCPSISLLITFRFVTYWMLKTFSYGPFNEVQNRWQ